MSNPTWELRCSDGTVMKLGDVTFTRNVTEVADCNDGSMRLLPGAAMVTATLLEGKPHEPA